MGKLVQSKDKENLKFKTLTSANVTGYNCASHNSDALSKSSCAKEYRTING